MPPPPLVIYQSSTEYRNHFEIRYCQGATRTSDGMPVYFKKNQFDHCFFESSRRDGIKDQFSVRRAERIDWIGSTLSNAHATLYQGWDKTRRRYEISRRVAVAYGNFVVIIAISVTRVNTLKATFITCFDADNSIGMIRNSPIWIMADFMNEI